MRRIFYTSYRNNMDTVIVPLLLLSVLVDIAQACRSQHLRKIIY